MDYISRTDAIYAIKKAGGCIGIHDCFETRCGTCQINFALSAVNDLPAADVVERKKGKWLSVPSHNNILYCSNCTNEVIGRNEPRNFCPNCGAEMEGNE